MSTWQAYLDDLVFTFRKQKQTAEKAFTQLDLHRDFFKKPGENSNSVAIIIKHLAGNLTSRFSDLLTSDGEKPWRDRDAEFVLGPADTGANLLAAWEQAWAILFATLATLQETDLQRTITIRGEEHTLLQALHRSLAHTAYHVGQIVYLARLLKTEGWEWITIPPGQSKEALEQKRPYLH
ncbi:MAG: DUF1572 family protein [Planctomycetes bacterium]|jgi:uncharacterized damage-inducible protein DinB|nr:DUF1572 family protein [Planctomycetota bacterium]